MATVSLSLIEGEDVSRKIARAFDRAASVIGGKAERYAKKRCPVKTGRLRNSITHVTTKEGKDTVVNVGSNVEYAPYVELGHTQEPGRYVPAIGKRLVADHVDGKPYLVPAIQDHLDEYKGILISELNGGTSGMDVSM